MLILIVILSATHSILFFLSLKTGKQFYSNSKRLQRLGEKVLTTKEKQLRSNKLLLIFDKKIQQGSTLQPRTILAFMILLKSFGMLLLGIIGLSLIVMPLQGVLMAALVQQSRDKLELREGFSKAILPQFITQPHLTIIGNLIGIKFFTDFYPDQVKTILDHPLLSVSFLIPLVASWVTARIEVNFYRNNRDLLRG